LSDYKNVVVDLNRAICCFGLFDSLLAILPMFTLTQEEKQIWIGFLI